jgi:hypothetical protein
MNKLLICSLIAPMILNAQMVFRNQTITVQPSQLSVESVEYSPASITTNTVYEWGETQQIATQVVSTNAAAWTVNVIFAMPAGHQWSLNNMPVTIQRFKTRLQVPVEPSAVAALFGPAAAGLEFAAQNGAYQPAGQVRDAFLSLAAAVLEAQ